MSSSIYAYLYVKHLLPFDFMKQNLSFDAGQTKRAFTVEVTLDQEKQIQQVKCYRSKLMFLKIIFMIFQKSLKSFQNYKN